MSIKLNC